MSAPRIFATAYDSLGLQVDRIGDAVADGAVALAALGVLQVITLVLPCLAIVLTATRIGRRRCAASSAGPRGARADGVRHGRHARGGGLRRLDLVAQRRLRADPARGARHAVGGRDVGDLDPLRPAGVDAAREREHGPEPTVRQRRAEERGTIGPVGEDEQQVAPPATTTTPAEAGDDDHARGRGRARAGGGAAGRDDARSRPAEDGAGAPGRDDADADADDDGPRALSGARR